MPGKKLTVAIIGAGNIAGGFDEKRLSEESGVFTHAGAYSASGKFILDTLYDTNYERMVSFKEYWRVGKITTRFNDILAKYHDVVSVCTPDDSHYDIIKELIEMKCCKTVFVEKPAALYAGQIEELIELSDVNKINVVVNFQRRYEGVHRQIREKNSRFPDDILTVNGYYIKGLDHIGTTMIDTLTFLCGYPGAVLAYNMVYNQEVKGYSYEFILFYDGFNITVKTVDSNRYLYNYHIFEIDILLKNGRITLLDNSRHVRKTSLSNFAYSGVKVLNDNNNDYEETGFKLSMLDAAEYIHSVTEGGLKHTVNTLRDSYNNKLILDKVVQSFSQNKKIEIGDEEWKR